MWVRPSPAGKTPPRLTSYCRIRLAACPTLPSAAGFCALFCSGGGGAKPPSGGVTPSPANSDHLGVWGRRPLLKSKPTCTNSRGSEQRRGGRVGVAGGDKTAAYRVLGGRDGAVQDEPAPQLHAGHGCAATILCTQLVSEQPPRRQPCAEGRRCKTVQIPAAASRARERWPAVEISGGWGGGQRGQGAAGKRESRPASDRARQQHGPCRGGSATP